MYPHEFDYAAPETLSGALDALARPGARPLAGGASLVPMLKLRLLAPELLVDLRRVPGLDRIEAAPDGTIRVGAMATHATVAVAQEVRAGAASLADAAGQVGDPAVRNQGTLCGSLAHADPVADEPGPVLALAATLVACSAHGERRIPADEFFVDAFSTSLQDGELLVAVELPAPGEGEGSAYVKIGRRGEGADYPVAGAAAWVRRRGDEVAAARVALTGAATKPTLLPAVAQRLIGTAGTDEDVAGSARDAADGLTLLGDVHGSADYKAHLADVVVRRALSSALRRAVDQ